MPTPDQRDYYAARAARVRQSAETASDPDIRQALLRMAQSYDVLVEHIGEIGRLRTTVGEL